MELRQHPLKQVRNKIALPDNSITIELGRLLLNVNVFICLKEGWACVSAAHPSGVVLSAAVGQSDMSAKKSGRLVSGKGAADARKRFG